MRTARSSSVAGWLTRQDAEASFMYTPPGCSAASRDGSRDSPGGRVAQSLIAEPDIQEGSVGPIPLG